MRKIAALFLTGTLVLIMISVVVRMTTWDVLIKRLKMDNFFTRAVFFDTDEVFEFEYEELFPPIDFKKEYPFTKNKEPFVDTSSVFAEDKREAEFDTTTVIGKVKKHVNFFLKERLLPYNFATDLALRYEGNIIRFTSNIDVFRLVDNYWLFMPKERKDYSELYRIIASINDFNLFLQEKNIPLLYIAIPNRLSPDSTYTFVNQTDIDKDFVYQKLKELGIPIVDLRENIRNENKDWYSLFYNTDHHWKAETGLWASKIIAEKLNSDFGFDLDASLLDPQNYNYKVYESWFLGSIGKKVGHYLAKPDDITLITPKFETKFDVKYSAIYMKNSILKENAVFDSALIFLSLLKIKGYNSSPYSAYMRGDNCAFIHNKLNLNGKRIMIIGESNVNVIVPFLAITNEYVLDMDLRHFDGSLESFIEKENPDIVIIAYNYVDGGKKFDFR